MTKNPKSPDDAIPVGEIVLFQTEDGRSKIQVRFEDKSLWLTQAAMAELFQTTPQNITLHLKAIYEEGELAEEATCKEYLQVKQEGKRQVSRTLRHYSLESVLAVGYRVRSHRGTQFRQWATSQLQELLVKGFVMDDERFKEGNSTAKITSTNSLPAFEISVPRSAGSTRRLPTSTQQALITILMSK